VRPFYYFVYGRVARLPVNDKTKTARRQVKRAPETANKNTLDASVFRRTCVRSVGRVGPVFVFTGSTDFSVLLGSCVPACFHNFYGCVRRKYTRIYHHFLLHAQRVYSVLAPGGGDFYLLVYRRARCRSTSRRLSRIFFLFAIRYRFLQVREIIVKLPCARRGKLRRRAVDDGTTPETRAVCSTTRANVIFLV